MKFTGLLSFASLASTVLLPRFVSAGAGTSSHFAGMDEAVEIQKESIERLKDFLGPNAFPGANDKRAAAPPPTIEFKNPKAQEFFVDGTKIPDGKRSYCVSVDLLNNNRLHILVNFDAGPSWSGLMPISGAKNETRKLFFWYERPVE